MYVHLIIHILTPRGEMNKKNNEEEKGKNNANNNITITLFSFRIDLAKYCFYPEGNTLCNILYTKLQISQDFLRFLLKIFKRYFEK